MNPAWRIPPNSKANLTAPEEISKRLAVLIGQEFPLTKKTRTDGSTMRKLVATTLENHRFPEGSTEYSILSEKGKGIPKLTREYIDTYIITSGESYNLQVWNRIPTNDDLQIEYADGSGLCASDVRFVLVRVDVATQRIISILVLTPKYIEENFGRFGAPTIKHQLLISNKKRREITEMSSSILLASDTEAVKRLSIGDFDQPRKRFNQLPTLQGEVLSLEVIREAVALPLIGSTINAGNTKNRGQVLEQIILNRLGYQVPIGAFLEGQYPDIKNQLLEVKIQDSPTIDLGKNTPKERNEIFPDLGITTKYIRYLIALMNPGSSLVEGIVLMPGEALGEHFTYIDGISGKSQRAIKMKVFDRYKGLSIFNPSQ